jgi:DNA polymerase-3 subunit delta'
MQLVTPSTKDVAAVLQSRDGISPQMADFAARVSQGHIGRAKYIATNEHVRSNRKVIMNLALHLTNVSEAFKAAQTLVDLATDDAKAAAEIRDEKEQEELAQAYGKGATGRGMATGGSKALKELEKEQKTRTTRMVRDSLDAALLDIATLYRDIMMIQSGHIDSLINIEIAEEIRTLATILPTHRTIQKLDAIMKARKNLGYNAAPLLTIETLMCELV